MASATSTSPHTAASDSGSWLTTTDHRRIARAHLFLALGALLLGVTYAALLRADLAAPGKELLGASAFGAVTTAHALVMIFLFALPVLPAVFGSLVLPGALGRAELAYPKLNRLAWQIHLVGAVLLLCSLLGGMADVGWRLEPAAVESAGWPVAAAAAGLHAVGLALAAVALNILATVLGGGGARRWRDQPVVVWGLTAGAAVQWIVGVVVATLGLTLLLDQLSAGQVFGSGGIGPLTYEHLFSFMLRAGVAVVLLPAMGIVGEVLATFARKAPEGGVSNPIAFGLLAALALAGGGVDSAATGQSVAFSVAQSGLRLLALVPAAILLYNAIATLHQAAIRITTPLLHALNFVLVVTIGGMSGLFLSTLSTGSYLAGSSFAAGYLHLVLGGGALAGLTTGLYYWWPRLYGRIAGEVLGRLGAALLFAGFLLAFLPRLIIGSQGLSAFSQATGFYASTLEVATSSGVALLFFGILVVIWNLAASLWSGEVAPSNPWGATTGEWNEVPRADRIYDYSSLRFDSDSRNYVSEGQAAAGQ